jgi:hypothetical protein
MRLKLDLALGACIARHPGARCGADGLHWRNTRARDIRDAAEKRHVSRKASTQEDEEGTSAPAG